MTLATKPRRRKKVRQDDGPWRQTACDCPDCAEYHIHWPTYYVGSGAISWWHRGKRKVKPIQWSYECYIHYKADLCKPQAMESPLIQGRYRVMGQADDPVFPAMVDGCPGCDGYGMRPRGKTYCLACAHRLGIDVAEELAEEIEIAQTTESVGQFAAAMGMIRYYGLRIERRRVKWRGEIRD